MYNNLHWQISYILNKVNKLTYFILMGNVDCCENGANLDNSETHGERVSTLPVQRFSSLKVYQNK